MTPSFYFEKDPGRWDQLVSDSPYAHLMQSWGWGDYKSRLGWEPYRMVIQDGNRHYAGAQILLKVLPVTGWKIGYIPKGPLISLNETELWKGLSDGFQLLNRQHSLIVIRSEPAYANHPQSREAIVRHGFRQTMQTNQPRCTFWVSLTDGETAVFERFSRNTKRLIRKAEREGVTVKEGSYQDVRFFYQQLEETSKRKHLPMQNISFYQEAFREFESSRHVQLLLAQYQNQIVSSLLVFFYQKCSMHLWAGNSAMGLKSNASHLLHWTAIKAAVKHGCTRCDLWGIPDEIAEIAERGEDVSRKRSDGLWGVYRFKEGFGGTIQCFVGAYDFVFRPAIYWIMQRMMSGQQTVDRVSSWLHRFS